VLPSMRIESFEPDRQRAGEVVLGVVVAEGDRPVVGLEQRRLLRELLPGQRADDLGVHAQQRRQGAGVGDVLHQDALAHALERAVAEFGQRHAEIRDVGPPQLLVERPRRVEHQPAAAAHLGDVLGVGRGVQRHHQVEVRRARGVAVLVDPDLVPGRQPLDVRREHVLARDRDAHPEDGLHDQAVGRGRAGAVGRRDLEREVVDAIHHLRSFAKRLRWPARASPAATRARTCACPTHRSGSARRTARSADRRSRP
jgi:hypothetical protein